MLKRTVYLDNTSWKRLEDIFGRRLEDVLKTSWKRLENVLKTFWRGLENVLKTSWGFLEDDFARHLEDILKTSWRRLENVLKTYYQDEYTGLDQDVFWRRMSKANIFVLIKASWRHLEDVFWRRRRKASSRGLQDAFIKRNVCCLRPATLLKRRLWHRCFPVDLGNF